jgi:hypothetical protein
VGLLEAETKGNHGGLFVLPMNSIQEQRTALQAQLKQLDEQEKAERRRIQEERRLKEQQEIEEMKESYSREHGEPRGPVFDKVWDMAWEQGHSAGWNDIGLYFDEYMDLVKLVRNHPLPHP